MRISRKRRPVRSLIPHFNVNDQIQSAEVRVIDAAGNNLGIMPRAAAIERARADGLDLVEINPLGEPPVVRLASFSQFKYQKEKEARKQRARSHVSELKGIRLSIRIGDHDLEVRRAQAQEFLERGDKVKVEIILRGRENARADRALTIIDKFYTLLSGAIPIHYEQAKIRQGNKVTAIVARTS